MIVEKVWLPFRRQHRSIISSNHVLECRDTFTNLCVFSPFFCLHYSWWFLTDKFTPPLPNLLLNTSIPHTHLKYNKYINCKYLTKNNQQSLLVFCLSGLDLLEAKASKGMHQVCIEKSPDHHYIRAENSSTGCGFCKMLWYCSILFYFELDRLILNQRKK